MVIMEGLNHAMLCMLLVNFVWAVHCTQGYEANVYICDHPITYDPPHLRSQLRHYQWQEAALALPLKQTKPQIA